MNDEKSKEEHLKSKASSFEELRVAIAKGEVDRKRSAGNQVREDANEWIAWTMKALELRHDAWKREIEQRWDNHLHGSLKLVAVILCLQIILEVVEHLVEVM